MTTTGIPQGKTQVSDAAQSFTTRINTAAGRLVLTRGTEKGRFISLKRDPITVGSDPTCDLVLTDATVSRKHATFKLVEGGAHVEDLGSTNGTFYEGSRVREIAVPFGATVTMGQTQIKVLPEEEFVKLGPVEANSFGGMMGQDQRMREIFALLADIAPTDTTVLIEGETGTGKELVARALHENSKRRGKPLVVFDCSAVPKDLVESALFGHVKGAFTGAMGARQGAFRSAHGGTIMLDEIGELPLEMQPKLLRALENRAVQAVGQDGYEKVDVRVVAATNRSLKSEVRAGRFREDLYYRLAVVKLSVPSLRERPQDVPILVEHFMQSTLGKVRPLDPKGLKAAQEYGWPGNVRELKNVVERAVHLSPPTGAIDLSKFIGSDETRSGARKLPEPPAAPPTTQVQEPETLRMERPEFGEGIPVPLNMPFKDAKAAVTEVFERRYFEALLARNHQNLSRAAQDAQMDRKHLRELLKKYNLWQGAED